MVRRSKAQHEAGMRRLLAQLRAGGKLAMIERDGATYIHIPEEYRHSRAAGVAYLLSCLPEQAPPAGGDVAAGGGG